MRRIGELLVSEGLLSEAAVNRALGYQRVSGEHIKIGSILLNWDMLAEQTLLTMLAKTHRCPAVDWTTLSAADIEAVRLLPAEQAVRLAAIPYALEKGNLKIAFADPSNLMAVDEISAITGKRVVPAVTTEVRLMQAHQKFYGRHIPGGFRIIVQKLERKTSQTRVFAQPRPPGDFRALDLLQAATAAGIPVSPDIESLSPPELPELEHPPSPARSSGLDSRLRPPQEAPRESQTDPLHPTPVSPVREDPIRSGDDSLTEWVGEALAAYQQDPQLSGPATPPPAASAQPPAEAAAPSAPTIEASPQVHFAPTEDAVAGMWRPAPLEVDQDDLATGMWTPGLEPGPQLWEARSREEIGEAVLQNALTHLPRVLLFGLGKTAITGWRGRGPNLVPEDIASVRLPASERSVFTMVEKTGVPHFGPVEESEWPPALGNLLGVRPPECAIFPIRILDSVAAFLYADRLGRPMQYPDFALIARAAASTANILARFLLRPNTAPVV
jgi:type II secretion system (T2SS) protein E